MGNYFKTVASAASSAFSAAVEAAKIIGPATVEAAKVIGPATVEATKETVTKINDFSDKANAKMVDLGLNFQSSADVEDDRPAQAIYIEEADIAEDVIDVEPAEEPCVEAGPIELVDAAYAYPVALVAVMNYAANCDEELSDEERAILNRNINVFSNNDSIPQAVKEQIGSIATRTDLTFEDVCLLLDKVSDKTLESLQKDLELIIAADDQLDDREMEARNAFQAYLAARLAQ